MGNANSLSDDALIAGVLDGDRPTLARAITLIESHHPAHQRRAASLLDTLLRHARPARRVGLSGVPGVGKSSLIESLGTRLCDRGERVAVLAVDPSSQRTGGSILGDKTRMGQLTAHPNAFIRPSPAGRQLGGVASATADTIALVEAAGFSTVIVETVGVGQSETLVSEMTDCFVLMMLPGAGDDLQGIKKGIVEMADIVTVNKADGDTRVSAEHAARDYQAALHTLRPRDPNWRVPVMTCSALTGDGLETLREHVERFFRVQEESGGLAHRRAQQRIGWLWQQLDTALRSRARQADETAVERIESAVATQAMSPRLGAQRLLEAVFHT